MPLQNARWLADVLRPALQPFGYGVVELDGWQELGNGLLTPKAVTWHHDGSPPGASPNVPEYIRGQVKLGKPGANAWVGLSGWWYLIAARMTFHAGDVLPGKPGNPTSIGVETDHTTGEPWSGVQLLDSLRRGTAAILRHLEVGPAGGLEFHKTVCKPAGRKLDPDGLELAEEQAAVAALMHPSSINTRSVLAWS
jgi:hypothetical protein